MAKKAEFSLETVKKYIFWACVPVGLLLAIVMNIIAVGKIGRAFENRKNELESQKSTVEKIRSEAEHPNENTILDVENCTKDLRGRVFQAWKTLEKDQKERNVWPVQVGPDFIREMSPKKFGDEISIRSREYYLNFVENYLPSMEYNVERRRVQILVDGKWEEINPLRDVGTQLDPFASAVGLEGMSLGGSDAGTSGIADSGTFTPKLNEDGEEVERLVGVVDWPNPETRTVTTHWGKLPKSYEVWYAQEDLWVYDALLWVIKMSNTGATGPHNAAVKRIESLLIGQAASQELAAQLSFRIGGSPGGEGGEGSMDTMGMGGGEGGEGGMGAMVARTEEDVNNLKKHFRYVNDQGVPLAYTDAPPFAQFNRMPIVLRLVVDQRKIPEILVHCANCAMPIDVLRVRLNPGESKPFDLSAYEAAAGATGEGGEGGGGMGMGMGGDVGYGGGGEGGRSTSAMGGGGGGDDSQIHVDGAGGIYGSNAIPIEIYGCINIFNPVEHDASLQAGETGTATEAETGSGAVAETGGENE